MDRDQAIRIMQDLLRKMSELEGSDLFITAGFPPAIKVDGDIKPVGDKPLTAQQSNTLSVSTDKLGIVALRGVRILERLAGPGADRSGGIQFGSSL